MAWFSRSIAWRVSAFPIEHGRQKNVFGAGVEIERATSLVGGRSIAFFSLGESFACN